MKGPAVPQLAPELAGLTQYEVVRELGRGGMGVAYLARNRGMGRLEVLKVMRPEALAQPGTKERFLQEIHVAASLPPHANVVTAYSTYECAGLPVLAMEYVDGEDLLSLVKSQGPLPVAQACDFARQVARGLQHAFEHGMVHRDIKPDNLMLSHQGEEHVVVKILDFGLAKANREKGLALGLTGRGEILGTPFYLAPEQARDSAQVDVRADVYSLGCTLYHLLAGTPPFQGAHLLEILHAHQAVEAAPLHRVRPEVPRELAAVVARMMAKDPANRYQKPVEVERALASYSQPTIYQAPTRGLGARLVQFDCPRCWTRQQAPASAAGQKQPCFHCGQRLQVPKPSGPSPSAAGRAGASRAAAEAGKQWFYHSGGSRRGPVTWSELRCLAADGKLGPADRVWGEGMAEWQVASTLPNLLPGPGATRRKGTDGRSRREAGGLLLLGGLAAVAALLVLTLLGYLVWRAVQSPQMAGQHAAAPVSPPRERRANEPPGGRRTTDANLARPSAEACSAGESS